MPRPRASDKHLPPCVYRKHGAYYLVRRGRWERLGADLPAALAAYARKFEAPKGTMPTLIDEYLATHNLEIARSTRRQYGMAAEKLKRILAEFTPEQVEAIHVVQVKRALANTPGAANVCITLLRQVFSYALEQQLVRSNPVVGVRRHKGGKRDRLLSQDELDRIVARAGPRLRCVLELCYYTGQRVGDVLRIRRADLIGEGIAFTQQKTGSKLIVRWTPELRAAVERAKQLHGNIAALTLLHSRTGRAPRYNAVREQWAAACRVAGVEDARLHDIRAMAATVAKRQGLDAQALLGHADPSTTRGYLRGREPAVVEGPGIGHLIDAKR